MTRPEMGKVYVIRSRNLPIGVYDGANGFIGIREKFGDRFLFTEVLNDPPGSGTVVSWEDTGIQLPEDIGAWETARCSYDSITGRPVAFAGKKSEGGNGWYFVDTNEASEAIRPCRITNDRLFKFLEAAEATLTFIEENAIKMVK